MHSRRAFFSITLQESSENGLGEARISPRAIKYWVISFAVISRGALQTLEQQRVPAMSIWGMVNPYDEPVLYAHMRSVEHGRVVPAGEAMVSANDEKESTSGKVAQCEGQER